MSNEPTFVPMWVRCEPCGHMWNAWQPSGVPIRVWVLWVRLVRCPQCGAGPRKLKMIETPRMGFVE